MKKIIIIKFDETKIVARTTYQDIGIMISGSVWAREEGTYSHISR
jgi:hypothetical protein